MLTRIDIEKLPSILSSQTIVKRGVRKIYYVLSGRNAWHSTWIREYRFGCMHLSFKAAKQHAESLRRNGSVFYIKEMPALVIQGEISALVVTQINCEAVFQEYSAAGYPSDSKSIDMPENQALIGRPLQSIARSFAHDSRYWRVSPPPNNSVLMFTTDRQLKDFEKYKDSSISEYRSASVGGDYALNWQKLPSLSKSNFVRDVVKYKRRGRSVALIE